MGLLRLRAVLLAALWPWAACAQPPAMTELAFVSLRDGEAQIYRRDAEGVIRPVTRGPGYSMHPAWSSKGHWAFAQYQGRSTRVLLCEADCQAPRRVSDEVDWQERSPSWAPDGESLAYVARPLAGGDAELRLLDLPTGRTRVLMKSTNGFGPDPLSWSADGRRMAVIAAGSDRTPHAWLIDRESAQASNLSEALFPQGASFAQLSPDGRQLAWVARRKGRNPVLLTEIASMETQDLMPGREVRAESPRWSPDGGRLVFAWRSVGAAQAHADVALLTVADRQISGLTDHPAEDFDPRWSGDGSSILFASLRTGTSLLYEVDRSGGPSRPVSEHKSHDMDAVPRVAPQDPLAARIASKMASTRSTDSTH